MAHGRSGRLITQFRLGLSPLHYDLFSHNTIDNPFCSICGDGLETQFHFFLRCSKYSEPRVCLMSELTNAESSFMLIALGNVNDAQCENIMDILIHGVPLSVSGDERDVLNRSIFCLL